MFEIDPLVCVTSIGVLGNHLTQILLDDEIFTLTVTEKHLIESTVWVVVVEDSWHCALVVELPFMLAQHFVVFHSPYLT